MTTTACDDQFAPGPIEPVRERFDIVSILRRNVASLEIALKRQTDRAEAAEEKLTTAREDMQSWIDSRNGWMERAGAAEAELERLLEREPVAFVCDYNGYAIDCKHTEIDTALPVGTDLYARHVPAPAPAVPAEFFTWVAAYGDYIEKLDVYNKKLTISKTLPFPGLDMNDEFQAFSAAQRKAHRMLPDLFEKARALLQSTGDKK